MNKKRQGKHRTKNLTEFCICPKCNYSAPHMRGVPCFTLICPSCKIPMTRQDSIGNNIHKTGVRSHLQTNKFPVADAALCIGCGACVAECLSGAIVLENKKAKINTDKCIKCMACINACPTEAIL